MRPLAGRLRPVLLVSGALLAVLGIALAWRYTGLSGVLTADNLREVLRTARGEPWAIVVVCAVFVLAGLMVFPLNVLVLTTAAVFGPWLGIAYGAAGALTSGTVQFWIGRWLGRGALERVAGPRVRKVMDGVRRRGLVTVVTFRLLPVAPFTLVNLAAGAGGIRFVDFVLGTAIGLAPGLVLLSIMGDRILRILSDPSAADIVILVLCVAGLIGLAVGAQSLLARRGRRAS
ncbi:MAG: TVP38/TMEM64 family protein [Proteobacteria bacterium]|nr:TVP38/TMEM64 family protein [Pseudomonadota bacterium]